MLSLVSSAEAARVDPGTYIADVLTKIAGNWPNSCRNDLLPHRWTLTQKPTEQSSASQGSALVSE
ncbi:MAG: transposase domain-containing protein [Deltaproteobacteria bacterium]|nr:transposase domain-containing protein [Deltaproteobacteria bacterium]